MRGNMPQDGGVAYNRPRLIGKESPVSIRMLGLFLIEK